MTTRKETKITTKMEQREEDREKKSCHVARKVVRCCLCLLKIFYGSLKRIWGKKNMKGFVMAVPNQQKQNCNFLQTLNQLRNMSQLYARTLSHFCL